MLRNLLRKDAILNGKVFLSLLWLFVWIAYAAGQLNAAGMATTIGAIAATLMTVTLGAREDRFHATAVVYSLPVTRRQVVIQRFVGGHLIGVLAFVIASVLMVAVPWSKHTWAYVWDPRTVLFALVTIMVTIALSMPLVLRFGVMGLMVGLGGIQLFGLAAFVLGGVLGGTLVLTHGVRGIETFVLALHRSLGNGAEAVLIVSMAGALTLVSFWLSLVLVERRNV